MCSTDRNQDLPPRKILKVQTAVCQH